MLSNHVVSVVVQVISRIMVVPSAGYWLKSARYYSYEAALLYGMCCLYLMYYTARRKRRKFWYNIDAYYTPVLNLYGDFDRVPLEASVAADSFRDLH